MLSYGAFLLHAYSSHDDKSPFKATAWEGDRIMNRRFIEIDGINIEVTEEVYFAYKRPAWREVKRATKIKEHEVSINAMENSGYELRCKEKSVEENVLNKFNMYQLRTSLNKLSIKDKWLITSIYFDGKTERTIAKTMGVSQNTVNYHRKRILKLLKKDLEKNI